MTEQPTTRSDRAELSRLEEEERVERLRNRVILAVVMLVGIVVAVWVGMQIDANQASEDKAQAKTEQVQVEKFNLAQQVAEACADPDVSALDEATYAGLCLDARTIVREGPQGAQGIPGVQGVQGTQGLQGIQGIRGPPGVDGIDGTNGLNGEKGDTGDTGAQGPQGEKGETGDTGAQGPQGEKGDTGSVGEQGPRGADGEAPFSWVVYGPGGQVVEECVRTVTFDPRSPTYTCTGPTAQ